MHLNRKLLWRGPASWLLALAFCGPSQGAPTQPEAVAVPNAEPQDIALLQADLRTKDPDLQMAAAKALAAMGEKAAPAAKDLVELLDAGSLERQLMMHVIRDSPSLEAMRALICIGPAAADALSTGLKSERVLLRQNTAQVLIRMGPEKHFNLLAPAASDADAAVRATVIGGLANVNTRESLALRLAALKDKDRQVRYTAAHGFRSLNPLPPALAVKPAPNLPDNSTLAQVVKALEPVLRDSEKDVRSAVATSLGDLRSTNAVAPLCKALDDSEPIVRSAIAQSLGKLGDRRAVPALLEHVSDKDAGAQRAIVSALGELKDPLATKALLSRLEDSPSVAPFAARALGSIGDRRAVPALIRALKIRGPIEYKGSTAAMAAEALGEIGDERAVEPLLEILRDARPQSAQLAASAVISLGQLRDPRAIKPLAELLFEKRGELRVDPRPLVQALKNIPHPEVVLVVADSLAASAPTPQNPYNIDAARLLNDLTGNRFEFDYDSLKRWWGANRQRYAEAAAEANTQPAKP